MRLMRQRFKALQQIGLTTGAMLQAVWRAHPLGLIYTFIVQILQGLLPLGTAWVTKLLFDALAQQFVTHNSSADFLMLPQMVLLLLVALALLTVIAQFVLLIDQYLSAELGRRLSLEIQTAVYKKVAGFAGLAYFEDPTLHNTIQLSVNGARLGPTQLLRSLMTITSSFITIASFIGVLLTFNLWLTGIVLIAALPQFFVQWRLSTQRFGVAFGNSPRERLTMYYGQVLTGVPFAKEMRLFNLGEYFLHAFVRTTKTIQTAQRKQQQRELSWQTLCTILSTLVSSGAFIFVFIEAFRGLLSFGDVSLYMSAVSSVQGTLLGIVFATTQMNEQILFFRQYTQLLAMPQPIPIAEVPLSVPTLSAAIELRDVSFRYSDKHPWVLRHVNLRIPLGNCLALVGLNGSGKTTLVKLLARLYDPTEGQILWDGIDIRAFDPRVLRQHIAAIFQDFMRYDLTVQENIGLGDAERIEDVSAIQEAAQQADIAKFITTLPQGYNTILSRWLGESKAGPGVDLSGGEWQKIALARMFMRNADMLMLDEPTAALDAQSEYNLHRGFAALMAGRTSLIITHRFSTVRMADTIAVLEDGRITEYGTHAKLLTLNGTYAHLYRMQAEQYETPTHVE